MEDSKKRYRDELIEEIKSVGQELIDRAEEFVGPDVKFVRDVTISITIPCNPRDEPTDIDFTINTFNTEKFRKEGWL